MSPTEDQAVNVINKPLHFQLINSGQNQECANSRTLPLKHEGSLSPAATESSSYVFLIC